MTFSKAIPLSAAVLLLLFFPSCTVKVEPLMPTPILFQELEFGPLDHIPDDDRWNLRRVYYATTRARNSNLQRIDYINEESAEISVGMAMIGFGGHQMTWDDLNEVSRQGQREETVPLSITGLFEAGNYTINEEGSIRQTQGAASWLFSNIDSAVQTARDKDILIFVHGAKVNFYNACAFAAQLDHFMGRDMTSIAFSWPTRQNIFAYAVGDDANRAYRSANALVSLVESLASETSARRIHILTWSAGGRLVTAALDQLRKRHADMSAEELRETYRLGTVYYAAADVPRNEFIAALPGINDLVDRVVVTASSNDEALKSAQFIMRGSLRIGQLGHNLEGEQLDIVLNADRLEFIDMSRGRDERGFDITGHRYWFNHPWASTDMLLSIRSDLEPEQRGLEPTEVSILWWMPEDYPQRLRNLVKLEENGGLRR
ncbi:MAG: alpha/beta hydrolase [Puniceicoccaceae bacterium]